MNRGGTQLFLHDLVGELETVMKSDSRGDLRKAQLPLLQICTDHIAPDTAPLDQALDTLMEVAIARVEPASDRRALTELFLGQNRWQPLARRGTAAASELGVSYDAMRRRNKSGHRRIDSLLTDLAASIVAVAPLEQLVFESDGTTDAPNPGENVFERASIFLSYSRHDDEHEGGLISMLRESLITEFRFQTGQELFVFHDKSSIDFGENWRRKLETGIDATSFLLVVLTPSYLRSSNCRDELQRFLQREEEFGRDDLVLPIYYATIPEIANDDLASTLLERQYVDWRNLRFQPFHAIPVRMAIAELAASIASAMARTADPPSKPRIRESPIEELGVLERLAEMELATPRFVRSLLTLSAEQEGVTDEVRQATEEMDRLNRTGRGSAARLIVTRRLSSKLEPYADRMEETAEAIRADLDTVEAGIRAMAEQLPSSTEEGIEEATETVISSLRSAQLAGEQASTALAGMSDSYSEVARTASTMRPVLHRLIGSTKVVADCPDRFAGWIGVLEHALHSRRVQ